MFKKVGDAQPIVTCYDDDGKEQVCKKCGSKLILIVIGDQDNQLVCKKCDLDDND